VITGWAAHRLGAHDGWKVSMRILSDKFAAVEGRPLSPRSMRRKQVPDRLPEIRLTADWDLPEAAYRQSVQIATDPEITHLPEGSTDQGWAYAAGRLRVQGMWARCRGTASGTRVRMATCTGWSSRQ
jgi:hypothetical protein